MKTVLVHSSYDKGTGLSYVKVRNKYGEFEATAQLHDEDKEYESTFFGCQVAETKCTIKTIKHKISTIDTHIKALENFEKTLKNLKEYNPKSIECCKLRKQIYLLKTEKQNLLHLIENIKAGIKRSEENRKATLAHLKEVKFILDESH